MEYKTYKVRVEIGMVVDIDVNAGHEDEAAAIAERIAQEKLSFEGEQKIAVDFEEGSTCYYDPDFWVANYGVKALDVKEVDYT